jgi:hypothetical protein
MKIYLAILLLPLLLSCNTLNSGNPGHLILTKDSVEIPPFEIAVHLSAAAEQKLKHDKETVIVWVWFEGMPKDIKHPNRGKTGELTLASQSIELTTSRKARFEGVKFSKSLYDALTDKNFLFLTNVVSGRRSGSGNLLHCNDIQLKVSRVAGKTILVNGKLIDEPDANR